MHLPSIDHIKPFFPRHRKCLVKNLLLFAHAMIESRSCSLYKCAERLEGHFESQYKRLLRFVRLRHAEQFALSVSRLIVALLPAEQPLYLVIDRSNWQLGRHPINVCYLGLLVSRHCFVPLLWQVLDKHGASNQDERLALLEQFLQLWPRRDPERALILLADREFCGRRWIRALRARQLGFVLRLRRDLYLSEVCTGLQRSQRSLGKYLARQVRRHGYCRVEIHLAGCRLYYFAVPDERHPSRYTCLLSEEGDVALVQQRYGLRWQVEVFFKHVKTNGFNLEDLNLWQQDRVRVLLAVVGLAYVLVLQEGLKAIQLRPPRWKRSLKTGQRWVSVSVFRLGYRRLLSRCRSVRGLLRLLLRGLGRKQYAQNTTFTVTSPKPIAQSVQ